MLKKIFAALAVMLIFYAGAPAVLAHSTEVTGYYDDSVYDRLSSSIRKKINKLDDDKVKKLPIPVLFGVKLADITANFGDPRSGGRSHEGLDIMATKGTPIVSPTEAVVLEAGEWEGAGYYVSTVNPGGENFIYMHLAEPSELDRGDWLDEGALVGFAGNTGNAAATAPHLHLEIRQEGEATDPYSRLKREFSLEDKMEYAETILSEADNEGELASLLVNNFAGDFLAAQAQDIDLPESITKKLAKTAKKGAELVDSGLAVGSYGDEVLALQKFLITQNKGPAAASLAAHGATYYYGPLTLAAVNEYRQIAGTAAPVKLTEAEIKAKIAQIQSLIADLQQQLAEIQLKTKTTA